MDMAIISMTVASMIIVVAIISTGDSTIVADIITVDQPVLATAGNTLIPNNMQF